MRLRMYLYNHLSLAFLKWIWESLNNFVFIVKNTSIVVCLATCLEIIKTPKRISYTKEQNLAAINYATTTWKSEKKDGVYEAN